MSNISFLSPANPDFDLVTLLSQSIEYHDKADTFEAFSLSPLTTPDHTPPTSPVQTSTALPSKNSSFPHNVTPSNPVSNKILPPQPSSSATFPSLKPSNSAFRPKKNPDRVLPPHRRERRNTSSKAGRAKQREGQKQRPQPAEKHVRPKPYERYVESATPVDCKVRVDMEKIKVADGAHVGLDDHSANRRTYALEDLIGENVKESRRFKLQTWDGESTMFLADDKERVIGILAGHPDDADWPNLHKQAAEALESRRSRCYVSKEDKQHAPRRGKFVALNCGVSYGGGQKRPCNRRNEPPNQTVINELNSLPVFKRISGFSNSAMAHWMPDLYDYYRDTGDSLFANDDNLERVFPSSVFPGATYNFGPQTVCYKHKDYGNLSFGVCPVTALGAYDYKKGGHLILWEFKTVVEFPPGSTILIPSAAISHSNVAIAPHETRYSFTQYSSGALFRWVDNKFQPRVQYLASLSEEQQVADAIERKGRLEFGLSLLPTVSSLIKRPTSVS